MRSLLASIFGISESDEGAFVKAGMSAIELDRLYELVRASACSNALEMGMANGTTALVICPALSQRGRMPDLDRSIPVDVGWLVLRPRSHVNEHAGELSG
jgi:hypothetical protein